jgi:hypothetical protein
VFLFFLQILSKTFLILRRIERNVIINVLKLSCKVPSSSCHSLTKREFSRFSKNSEISNVTDIRQSGDQVFPCGQTEVTKPIVGFCNYAKAPENVVCFLFVF